MPPGTGASATDDTKALNLVLVHLFRNDAFQWPPSYFKNAGVHNLLTRCTTSKLIVQTRGHSTVLVSWNRPTYVEQSIWYATGKHIRVHVKKDEKVVARWKLQHHCLMRS